MAAVKRKAVSLFLILFLAVTPLLVFPVHATTIFSDGFESGDFSAWTGIEGSTSPTVENTYKHHGSYAMKSNPLSNDQEDCYKTGLTATAIMYERFYIYFASGLPASGQSFDCGGVGSTSWSNAVFCSVANISGNIYWGIRTYIGGSESRDYESTASNPTTGVWYCVELVRDVTNSKSQLYVNSNKKVDVSKPHSGNNNMIWAGIGYVTYTGLEAWTDCVVVADAYIGPEASGYYPYVQIITETLKVNDAVARYATYIRITAETVTVADVIQRQASFMRSTTETTLIGDSTQKYGAFTRFTTETAVFGDLTAKAVTYVFTEAFHTTDTVTSITFRALIQLITETLHVSDSATTLTFHALVQLITETLHIADAFFKAGTFQRTITEKLHIPDTPLTSAMLNLAITELLSIADAVAHMAGIILGEILVTDTVHFGDGVILQYESGIMDIYGLAVLAFVLAVAAIAMVIAFKRD